jgi:hypothetical protein
LILVNNISILESSPEAEVKVFSPEDPEMADDCLKLAILLN